MNPFRSEAAARRYSAGRLYIHAEFARRIAWGLARTHIDRALDLGCGTGLSTRALAGFAARVVGIDCSAPMLQQARGRFRGPWTLGRGEALPFSSDAFDLVTLGCVFHWCDAAALLREVSRVLRPDGHLAVYDHCLLGRMEHEPRFASWFETYRTRFPAPPRRPHFDATKADGFLAVSRERFQHLMPLTLEELFLYIASQSNVLSALDGQGIRPEDIETELRTGLAPLFGGRRSARFAYQGELDVLRKVPGQVP